MQRRKKGFSVAGSVLKRKTPPDTKSKGVFFALFFLRQFDKDKQKNGLKIRENGRRPSVIFDSEIEDGRTIWHLN